MSLKAALESVISTVGKLRAVLSVRVSALWKAFDRRDIFFFGGLLMLGYGLYITSPAVAYSVCGGILLVVGLIGSVFGGTK